MKEKEQINEILKGNEHAFNYFIDTYQNSAFNLAYQICQNRQDAEDIVQDAFVKAYFRLNTFRGDSKFSSWLYRIVYNMAISHCRKTLITTVNLKDIITNHYYEDNTEQIEKKEQIEIIYKTFIALSHNDKCILTLFYIEEVPVKDISKIMRLSESNIKIRLHRARKKLSEKVRYTTEYYAS